MTFIADYNCEYRCLQNINLYDAPGSTSLATQTASGRHLIILPDQDRNGQFFRVRLCEDGYIAWLSITDTDKIIPTKEPYQAINYTPTEIVEKIPAIVNFVMSAMSVPNYYLWGGTVAPNYDCSGLIQAGFASQGIWLPRDSYQQEEFTEKINFDQLEIGDLLFFAKIEKISHVALYLGDGNYIHSSGKEQGRNGIGIDSITNINNPISQEYFKQLKTAGRVMKNYQIT
jgi:cell wall-associated NlpC family hydrolase